MLRHNGIDLCNTTIRTSATTAEKLRGSGCTKVWVINTDQQTITPSSLNYKFDHRLLRTQYSPSASSTMFMRRSGYQSARSRLRRIALRTTIVRQRAAKSPQNTTVTTATCRRQLITFSKPFDKRLICAARRLPAAEYCCSIADLFASEQLSLGASTTMFVARYRSAIPRVFNQTYSDRPEAPVLAIVGRKVPRSWPGSRHFGT